MTFSDSYIDQETGVLRNLIGARTSAELREAEAGVIPMAEISLDDVARTND